MPYDGPRLLRAAIKRRGLNQAKAAALLDVPQSTISRWLHDTLPSPESFDKLRDVLGITASAWVKPARPAPKRRCAA